MENRPHIDAEQLFRDIAILRDMMLAVHYYEESHWLAAAVSFRHLCHSEQAQEALRRAATIAWQFRFPGVSHWLNTEILVEGGRKAQVGGADIGHGRLPPLPDVA